MRNTKVVSAGDPEALQYLWDFETKDSLAQALVRVRGEGRYVSTVFPNFSQTPKKVLLEFLPTSKVNRPLWLFRWTKALRLSYFGMSFFPLALVAILSGKLVGLSFWPEALLFLFSLFFIHSACVLWGEAEDHLRGVDLPTSQNGSGVVRSLWISARSLRKSAVCFLVLGLASGMALSLFLPLKYILNPLLFLGFLGVLGAASYSGWPFHYKYLGLGEPLVFFLSGPLLAMVASLVFLGTSNYLYEHSLLVFPLAMTTVNLLHVGNLQRIPFDNMAGVATIASRLGFDRAKTLLCVSIFFPFLLQIALVLGNLASPFTYSCLLALPHAIFLLAKISKWKGPLDPRCLEGKRDFFLFQFSFGLLLLLGTILSGKETL